MRWTQDMPAYGDIIRVKVHFYHHYGIFADENTVIQFGMPDNGNTPPDSIEVLTTDINTFSGGEFIERGVPEGSEKASRRTPEETVDLALSRLGEKGYNILSNNCEHFATECFFGEKRSSFDKIRKMLRKKLNIKDDSK